MAAIDTPADKFVPKFGEDPIDLIGLVTVLVDCEVAIDFTL